MTTHPWIRRLFVRTPRANREVLAQSGPSLGGLEDRVVPSLTPPGYFGATGAGAGNPRTAWLLRRGFPKPPPPRSTPSATTRTSRPRRRPSPRRPAPMSPRRRHVSDLEPLGTYTDQPAARRRPSPPRPAPTSGHRGRYCSYARPGGRPHGSTGIGSAAVSAPPGAYVGTTGTAAADARPDGDLHGPGGLEQGTMRHAAGLLRPLPFGATAATLDPLGTYTNQPGAALPMPAPAGSYRGHRGRCRCRRSTRWGPTRTGGRGGAILAPAGCFVGTVPAPSRRRSISGDLHGPAGSSRSGTSSRRPAPIVPSPARAPPILADPGYYVPVAGASAAIPADARVYVSTTGATQEIPDPPRALPAASPPPLPTPGTRRPPRPAITARPVRDWEPPRRRAPTSQFMELPSPRPIPLVTTRTRRPRRRQSPRRQAFSSAPSAPSKLRPTRWGPTRTSRARRRLPGPARLLRRHRRRRHLRSTRWGLTRTSPDRRSPSSRRPAPMSPRSAPRRRRSTRLEPTRTRRARQRPSPRRPAPTSLPWALRRRRSTRWELTRTSRAWRRHLRAARLLRRHRAAQVGDAGPAGHLHGPGWLDGGHPGAGRLLCRQSRRTKPTLAPPGYYVPVAGASQAIPAAPGFYVPTAGATQQIPDPPGTTSGVAATAPTPASLVVTTTTDVVNPYDGVTSLREAIDYANTLSGPQTITFDPSMFANGPATISLSESDDFLPAPPPSASPAWSRSRVPPWRMGTA